MQLMKHWLEVALTLLGISDRLLLSVLLLLPFAWLVGLSLPGDWDVGRGKARFWTMNIGGRRMFLRFIFFGVNPLPPC